VRSRVRRMRQPSRSGTNPASVVPELDPCDLIVTNDHPRCRIGRMVGLVQIIGRVQVNIGSVGIHLLAIVPPETRLPGLMGAQ
jgi:hypothetical protein